MEEQLQLRVFLTRTEGLGCDKHRPIEQVLERVLVAKHEGSIAKLRDAARAHAGAEAARRRGEKLTDRQQGALDHWVYVKRSAEVESGLDRVGMCLDRAWVNMYFYVEQFGWGPDAF